MRRLNFTNKLYVALLMLIVVATIVKIIKYRGWQRYYYGASFSAPPSYPVYVREGYFLLPDEDFNSIITELNHRPAAWGEDDYQNPSKKERLPNKLVLQYASYRESTFYTDTITLPTDLIKKAFENVDVDGIENTRYNASTVKRLDFVVGIANGGNIIVWLRGEKKEITLLKKVIKPHEPIGEEIYYDGTKTKAQYLERVFAIDSATKADINRGVDINASYIDSPSSFQKLLKIK